ncbi:alpha/beta hydrolase [Bacillus sp. HMF5848]|uniref:alpha/beta fold hydrolase n=1 Tax=Bacillus sp. HMF5848 TaxID=2495421 RepID=UPI000F7AD662|nr:alpha/beta hydrolase [Bacillus sp. HMF5848]RSK25904.1 alpha/beta hydrolase [Bacillus sp. HMF5848]
MMQEHIVQLKDAQLHVTQYSEAGEPVFLLHPGGFNGFIWSKVIPYLKNHFMVYTVDFRGHGRSPYTKSGYEMENQANDLIAIMDELNLDRVHMVGNSLGTDVAVHAAAMYSDRVKSLVNIDAGMLNFIGEHGEMDGTKEEWLKKAREKQIIEFDSRSDFKQFIAEVFGEFGDEYVQLCGEHVLLRTLSNGKLTHMMPSECYEQLMEAWCDIHFESCYPSVKCPVLFLPAEREPKLAEKLVMVEHYKQYLSDCEVVIIEGMTHIPLTSHASELSHVIRKFFNRIS